MRHLTFMISGLALLGATACDRAANGEDGAPALSGRIVIAGDSTAADYPADRAPQTGWGQVLDYYLTSEATVDNRAVNGRSTKSYIDEGRWAELIGTVKPGDLVLISFGHNDSRDDAPERYAAADGAYRENMARFAGDVKAAGGVPVIVSPAARRLWEGPAMVETHGLYRLNAEVAAQESGAGYIDLAQRSMDYFETLGKAGTKDDFLWLSPEDASVHFPEGVEDNTHFKEIGACGVARVIARQLGEAAPEAKPLVRGDAFTDSAGDEAGRPADVLACAKTAWD